MGIWACNEPATSGTDGVDATDSLHNDNINNSDVNNRNTTKYDSANAGAGKDTVSYEKKTTEKQDSIPR